jgi:hypothetical protein
MNCAICLDTDGNGDLVKLECGHSFDETCINRWINQDTRNNDKCPICQLPYPVYRPFYIDSFVVIISLWLFTIPTYWIVGSIKLVLLYKHYGISLGLEGIFCCVVRVMQRGMIPPFMDWDFIYFSGMSHPLPLELEIIKITSLLLLALCFISIYCDNGKSGYPTSKLDKQLIIKNK